jgi:hypothetical protein
MNQKKVFTRQSHSDEHSRGKTWVDKLDLKTIPQSNYFKMRYLLVLT